MKLTRLLPALLSSLFLLAVPAEARPPQDAAPAKEKARPALWKVADEDTTIWLFGTIHILPPGIDWYNGPIAAALEGSDTLVTEIVEPDDKAMAAKMATIALSDPPRNLREQLSPEDRRSYEAALSALQLPAAAFDANDPWYAAVALSTLPLMKEGYGTMSGAEAILTARAKEKGMGRAGLETPESQLALFDSLPQNTQISYLHEVLESLPDVRRDIMAMVEAWKEGKADKLARLMNAEESDPVLMKVLLTDRNKTWARWIEERLKRPGTVFVAVGAGHLAGRDSVQAQLAAGRIKVTRVR